MKLMSLFLGSLLLAHSAVAMEAEDAKRTRGSSIKDGYVLLRPNTSVIFTFNLPQQADYIVWVRLIPNADYDSLDVRFDNSKAELCTWQNQNPSAVYQWHPYKTAIGLNVISPQLVNLTAGKHTLQLTARNKDVKIDKITITDENTVVED